MNELQLHLYHVITSLIETDGLDGYFLDQDAFGKKRIIEHSAIRYGILNYVAKYSLANDTYFITSKCYEHIKGENLSSVSIICSIIKPTLSNCINTNHAYSSQNS